MAGARASGVRSRASTVTERHATAQALSAAAPRENARGGGIAIAIASDAMGLAAISKSKLGDIADNVLAGLVATRAQSTIGPALFASLFAPAGLSDPLGQLSSRELVAVLGTARSTLIGLSSAAGRLDLSNPLSTFYRPAIVSSDTSVLTARAIPGASVPPSTIYRFTVSQLAQAQANVGTALSGSATYTFTAGTNTARITQNGVVTDVSFTVLANDNNETVLTSFAAAINATSGLGVSASVHTDTVAGTSQLVLSAATAGTANSFTLSNVAGTPVTDAGVTSASVAAANAIYSENGVPLTASTNDLYLGNDAGVHVTFLATTSSPVLVAVDVDTQALSGSISTLLGSYNTAHNFFSSNDDVYPAVARQLRSTVSRLGGQLDAIGILAGADGSLSSDGTRLASSLTDMGSSVRRAIGDAGGLAPDLRTIADTFLAQPSALYATAAPMQTSYGPQQFAAQYAGRLNGLRLQGLLLSALA